MKTTLECYRGHWHRAKRKDIKWCFTFETWVQWWEGKLGPDWRKLRGNKRGQYVMARKADVGPYHPDNVECITCGQNAIDAIKNGVRLPPTGGRRGFGHKLTVQEVKCIYKTNATQRSLAKKYGVSERLIRLIKNKQVWKSLLA